MAGGHVEPTVEVSKFHSPEGSTKRQPQTAAVYL